MLIWCGDVMSGEMELEVIEAAFRGAGALVKVVKPDTSTPAEFIKEYETGEYDVFWVSSHGELDHWSPHEIQLRLAHDKSAVMLDDLWNRVPENDGRRLLVLNICDGARFGDPCLLRGSDDVMAACKNRGMVKGKTTPDGLFTLTEVECMGTCTNAPMVQINDDNYEDLDYDSMVRILDDLAAGKQPKTGPQNPKRHTSEPEGGPTTLKEMVKANHDYRNEW